MENDHTRHPAADQICPAVSPESGARRIETDHGSSIADAAIDNDSEWCAARFRVEVLAAVAILLQLADYICTSIGVARYGVRAEGNPMVRQAMTELGATPVLLIIKSTAMLMVAVLVVKASCFRRVERILIIVCSVYLLAVVGPWLYFIAR